MTALAMQQTGLKPAAKVVLYWLADHHNGETGLCCPSLKALVRLCEMDRSTVVRHMDALELAGLVGREQRTRDNGSQTSTAYTLSLTPVAERNSPCSKTQQGPVAKCHPQNLGRLNLGNEPREEPPISPTADVPSIIRARLPEGWTPTDDDMGYASSMQIHPDDIKEIADDFYGYWSERTDASGKKSERGWSQAWRNRCRDIAPQYRRNRNVQPSRADATLQAIAFAARAGRAPSEDSF